ncbi:T-complex protein 1 subunit theta [Cystobasidiomycetes sp. EMM_F5]
MSLKIPRAGPSLFKDGYSFQSGIEDAVIRNIQAVGQITEIVRTSFGPNGRNKMVINHLERLFVTNDAATIIRELEVVHPAAKVLVMASQQQEAEMGDRTNFVLMFAGELLRKAEYLLTVGLHPSEIIAGYELAREKAEEALNSLKIRTLPLPLTQETLSKPLRSVLAAKQYGQEDFLAELVSKASLLVMPAKASDFNVDNVRVVKIMGGSLEKSTVIAGMVFGREPEGEVQHARKGKVAVYTSGIDVAQTETKGTVLLKNADDLLGFSRGEEKHLEKVIKEIADAGVTVVIAGSAVGELALHYLNRYNIMVVKVLSKFDLRRLCRVIGATPLARLGAPTPEEAGSIDVVETIEIAGDRVTVFRQEEEGYKTRTATIVIRGATTNRMDDIERAIDDGVNVVKSILKDPRVIPGAGSTELAMARQVAELGERTPGLAQHGIKRFAEALEVVPRTLAENAGLDATEVVARLLSLHATDRAGSMGVDVEGENGGVLDAAAAGIFDLMDATLWAVRYGTEAAINVLRVDVGSSIVQEVQVMTLTFLGLQSIIVSRASGIAPPKKLGHWDED